MFARHQIRGRRRLVRRTGLSTSCWARCRAARRSADHHLPRTSTSVTIHKAQGIYYESSCPASCSGDDTTEAPTIRVSPLDAFWNSPVVGANDGAKQNMASLFRRADPNMPEAKKLSHLMRGVKEQLFVGLGRYPPTTVDEFIKQATAIERALQQRYQQYDRLIAAHMPLRADWLMKPYPLQRQPHWPAS